jgi:hypothetical protein
MEAGGTGGKEAEKALWREQWPYRARDVNERDGAQTCGERMRAAAAGGSRVGPSGAEGCARLGGGTGAAGDGRDLDGRGAMVLREERGRGTGQG